MAALLGSGFDFASGSRSGLDLDFSADDEAVLRSCDLKSIRSLSEISGLLCTFVININVYSVLRALVHCTR